MYKIGFLGSDNSHVEKFCEILNLSNHEKFWSNSGAKVTGIWGEVFRSQKVEHYSGGNTNWNLK